MTTAPAAEQDFQKVLVRMPRELALRLKEAAWRHRTDRNADIVRVLVAYCDHEGIPNI
jgi:hypothetical protein